MKWLCGRVSVSLLCHRGQRSAETIRTKYWTTDKVRYGHFLTRCVANSFTSLGLVALCFYRHGLKHQTYNLQTIYRVHMAIECWKTFESGYCVMISWVLMGCSAVYYIGSNSSLVPFFGIFAGLAMMTICGVYDMSAALFLLFKLAWQNYERFKL